MYPALATLAFVLLVAGWFARRRRRAHVPLVLLGIGLDLTLVIILETNRSVIDQSMNEVLDWSDATHIIASILAVVLYLPTLALGATLLLGKPGSGVRTAHRRIANAALFCRAVGFAFMWTLG